MTCRCAGRRRRSHASSSSSCLGSVWLWDGAALEVAVWRAMLVGEAVPGLGRSRLVPSAGPVVVAGRGMVVGVLAALGYGSSGSLQVLAADGVQVEVDIVVPGACIVVGDGEGGRPCQRGHEADVGVGTVVVAVGLWPCSSRVVEIAAFVVGSADSGSPCWQVVGGVRHWWWLTVRMRRGRMRMRRRIHGRQLLGCFRRVA